MNSRNELQGYLGAVVTFFATLPLEKWAAIVGITLGILTWIDGHRRQRVERQVAARKLELLEQQAAQARTGKIETRTQSERFAAGDGDDALEA